MKTKKEMQRWLSDQKDALGSEIRFYQGQLDNLYSSTTARKCIVFHAGERNIYQILNNRLIDDTNETVFDWAFFELTDTLKTSNVNSPFDKNLRGRFKGLATFIQWAK
tara:strand:- start:150 stop:473 length:324 start_codon:yes stop_codon:yes gene_type:complete